MKNDDPSVKVPVTKTNRLKAFFSFVVQKSVVISLHRVALCHLLSQSKKSTLVDYSVYAEIINENHSTNLDDTLTIYSVIPERVGVKNVTR